MKEKALQQPIANFGQLFKFFRQQAGFNTIGQFADALADENIIYCESLYYHWQRNNKVPNNRQLILQIIKIFINHGGLVTSNQANIFLESTGKGYLTNLEQKELTDLDTNPTIEQTNNFYNSLNEFIQLEKEKKLKNKNLKSLSKKIPKAIRFNFMVGEDTHKYIAKIAKQEKTTKSNFIRQLISEYKQRENSLEETF